MDWFEVIDTDSIDSPALLLFPERISNNIHMLKQMVDGNTDRLRPHAKTHKMIEVSKMLIEEGVNQFKCSTIAEAEMLAMSNAKDVLMAYQPVGPKINRWIKLIQKYPNTHFSCLVDNVNTIAHLGSIAEKEGSQISIYIDINIGMGRTGASLNIIDNLWASIKRHKNLILEGVHGYDGHIHNPDIEIRELEADASYSVLRKSYEYLQQQHSYILKIVIGGSPSFSIHAKRKDVVCSPGTFIFWDWGYSEKIPEQKFEIAAVLMARVISIINDNRVCIDLGYKAVASDPPLPRVKFLNASDAIVAFQSEEHMVIDVENSLNYPIGKVLYAIPTHICPTVALYDKVKIVNENNLVDEWSVMGRNRTLNI